MRHLPHPAAAATATVDQLDAAPCLAATCPGHLRAQPHPAESFYRSMYAGAHVRRVDSHEHTSLLDAKERAAVEAGFKRPTQVPGDPNVLVATPTLEMGIDIGDLSTVMLGSLPATVASYVQRVGRAGRRSGSALALAYVPGRRSQLPFLDAPDRLLNGSVAPPSTYLGAEEILRRQFLASVIDTLTRENHPSVPSGGPRRRHRQDRAGRHRRGLAHHHRVRADRARRRPAGAGLHRRLPGAHAGARPPERLGDPGRRRRASRDAPAGRGRAPRRVRAAPPPGAPDP